MMEPCCYLACETTADHLLASLDLSVRTKHVMRSAGIKTIGELCQVRRGELLRLPSCGRKTVNELQRLLQGIGLCMRA